MDKIDKFDGVYRFLSNFYECPVEFGGIKYRTSEHAYQAQKQEDPEYRMLMAARPTARLAKRMGGQATARPGWEEMKNDVMLQVVRAKFSQNHDLAALLLGTGDMELVEGNDWGDRHFGVCQGAGHNFLGKILMQVRAELRKEP